MVGDNAKVVMCNWQLGKSGMSLPHLLQHTALPTRSLRCAWPATSTLCFLGFSLFFSCQYTVLPGYILRFINQFLRFGWREKLSQLISQASP